MPPPLLLLPRWMATAVAGLLAIFSPVVPTVYCAGDDPDGPTPARGVDVVRHDATLEVSVGGSPFLSYAAVPRLEGGHGPEFTRGAFLHPVRSPSGVLVTDAFSHDHPHQTGVFAAWTSTRFHGHELDFWNMGKKLGRVEPVAVERAWSGPSEGGFVAHHRYVDLTGVEPVPVVEEWWHVTAHATEPGAPRVFDLETRQTVAGPEPLELLEWHYGGFTFRGHARWLDTRRIDLLTSEGVRDRVAANGTRVRWCAMAGEIDGAVAGLAILAHPSNFRAPQPIRVHPSMPMLCFAPTQSGPHTMRPGEWLRDHYRIVVFDGPPDPTLLEAQWQAFARPPAAAGDPKH